MMSFIKLRLLLWIFISLFSSCEDNKREVDPEKEYVARIIKALSADDMQGRAAFTAGAEKAAKFIENEFSQIGLYPLIEEAGFRQTFYKRDVTQEGGDDQRPLFNIVGMLPGKSKPEEIVVISAHYDHIGIIEPLRSDSIANGADDDASGVTAVISLAKYFKNLNNNARTLIFVAFTAEELGGFGAKYFSKNLNPDKIVGMFNIEMIGKQSKFGKNTAYITGYEKSNLGQILQRNLEGTGFKFYPDPYPKQNLFYRSDNATLAALGVPAHTISTVQIDRDKYYHTVDDELETLEVSNINATIKAIALSSRTIVEGTDTPSRVKN